MRYWPTGTVRIFIIIIIQCRLSIIRNSRGTSKKSI